MNDEVKDVGTDESFPTMHDAADLVNELQDTVDALEAELASANARISELVKAQNELAAPLGDAELRALAVTVRTARRNGHPDADKHLEALLRALGA